MAHMVKVTGVKAIKKAMKKANTLLGDGQRKGLIKGGLYIQRKSQQVVPVEYGILKNSAGTKAIGHGWYTDVIVYYTASYAVYVHERVDLRHKPGKYAKFLERPVRENMSRLLLIISGEMSKHMKRVRSFKGKS
ncbi:MAG: hypothetical protein ACTSO3_01160 [Candidatus Heimdallarchaeaceae archaeon]